ncbi:MAG: hypothetical protein HOO86_02875 [Bacteroidales bacterium]|nr:hypothetical protein [Bacteroidales bacterium]
MYNITLEFSKNTVSGLLILKKTSDSTFRLILNAEMGPKLLDMELLPNEYKTIYAYKKLNKRRILKTFYIDFASLTGILTRNKAYNIDYSRLSTDFTYDLGKKNKIIYSSEPATTRINSGKMEDENSINTIFYYFYDSSTSGISSMKLEHQHFRMVILLKKINL